MTLVLFLAVPVGGFFKEAPDGAWHLKTSSRTGLWRGSGMESQPIFDGDERVWVEPESAVGHDSPHGRQ